jgi:hypothetical protein
MTSPVRLVIPPILEGIWTMLSASQERQRPWLEPQAGVLDLPRSGAQSANQAEETAKAGEAGGTSGPGTAERHVVHGLHGRQTRRHVRLPAAQCARRLQPRGAWHRGGLLVASRKGGPLARKDHRMAGKALGDQGGRRPGIHQQCVDGMDRNTRHRHQAHRTRQAAAEACIERYNRTVRHQWLGQYLSADIKEVQDTATEWLWT